MLPLDVIWECAQTCHASRRLMHALSLPTELLFFEKRRKKLWSGNQYFIHPSTFLCEGIVVLEIFIHHHCSCIVALCYVLIETSEIISCSMEQRVWKQLKKLFSHHYSLSLLAHSQRGGGRSAGDVKLKINVRCLLTDRRRDRSSVGEVARAAELRRS